MFSVARAEQVNEGEAGERWARPAREGHRVPS